MNRRIERTRPRQEAHEDSGKGTHIQTNETNSCFCIFFAWNLIFFPISFFNKNKENFNNVTSTSIFFYRSETLIKSIILNSVTKLILKKIKEKIIYIYMYIMYNSVEREWGTREGVGKSEEQKRYGGTEVRKIRRLRATDLDSVPKYFDHLLNTRTKIGIVKAMTNLCTFGGEKAVSVYKLIQHNQSTEGFLQDEHVHLQSSATQLLWNLSLSLANPLS